MGRKSDWMRAERERERDWWNEGRVKQREDREKKEWGRDGEKKNKIKLIKQNTHRKEKEDMALDAIMKLSLGITERTIELPVPSPSAWPDIVLDAPVNVLFGEWFDHKEFGLFILYLKIWKIIFVPVHQRVWWTWRRSRKRRKVSWSSVSTWTSR